MCEKTFTVTGNRHSFELNRCITIHLVLPERILYPAITLRKNGVELEANTSIDHTGTNTIVTFFELAAGYYRFSYS